MSDADYELLSRAVAGDRDALTELLRTRGPVVREKLTISKTWQGSIDADDVMQVTYMEAFLRIGQFQSNSMTAFVAWLSTMAQNNLRDAIKELERGKRPNPRKRITAGGGGGHGGSGGEDSCFALLDLLGGTTSTPSMAAARGEARRMLESAVGQLPEVYEDVVRRYDLEGQPVQDVAKHLGRSTGAVYMLRARALDMLRDFLGSRSQFLSAR